MHKSFITLYYFFLAAVSLSTVLFTIYSGSQTIAYGQTVGELERQQKLLAAEQMELQQEISQVYSLSTTEQLAQANGYVTTTRVIQLPIQTQVALR